MGVLSVSMCVDVDRRIVSGKNKTHPHPYTTTRIYIFNEFDFPVCYVESRLYEKKMVLIPLCSIKPTLLGLVVGRTGGG